MSVSESGGQEDACTYSGLREHYSELLTWMAALKF